MNNTIILTPLLFIGLVVAALTPPYTFIGSLALILILITDIFTGILGDTSILHVIFDLILIALFIVALIKKLSATKSILATVALILLFGYGYASVLFSFRLPSVIAFVGFGFAFALATQKDS